MKRRQVYIILLLTAMVLMSSWAEVRGDDKTKSQRKTADLPEVVVEKHKNRILHILGYVREYSALTNYTDTIFLFREKMVDFMLPPGKKIKFDGWTKPRVLSSKSYYKFSNNKGLDSVSNTCNYHFSWSDWMTLPASEEIPTALRGQEKAVDSVGGRYGVMETWLKDNDKISWEIDVVADTLARERVPDFVWFFNNNIDFDKFRVRYEYENVLGDHLFPTDLKRYSYNIESYGRGHRMFGFSRSDQPYYVTTDATVYLMDQEYLTEKEAKKWSHFSPTGEDAVIYASADAPELGASILDLMERVSRIDSVGIRINDVPDVRLSAQHNVRVKYSAGEILLQVLKEISGIGQMQRDRANYKDSHRWNKYFQPEKKK